MRRCCGRGPATVTGKGACRRAPSRPPPPSSPSRRPPDTTPESSHTRTTPESLFTPESSGNSSTAGQRGWPRTPTRDGGWGDTPDSRSNISTTALAWGALNVATSTPATDAAARKAEAWLTDVAGGVDGASLRRALDARYGSDRTFSVPILTALAIAGRLRSWRHVAQLPFELAAAPHQLFASLRLPVVSYALPALIAIGQVRHQMRPTRNPATWLARTATRRRTLATLRAIQPTTGGFLEATPLTSFVVMSLAALDRSAGAGAAFRLRPPRLDGDPNAQAVIREGVAFLARSVRDDGSWPIDTNLATWATTLSIEALAAGGPLTSWLDAAERATLLDWILGQQYRVEHPYTHAAPGGWAWTDLAGGVPDADDTAGALLALAHLLGPAGGSPPDARVRDAAEAGVRWLLDLQNRDGGVPTFCRGWTGLPFDRSGPELTAHAVRAWCAWRPHLASPVETRIGPALDRASRYLARVQHVDGAFAPLWFGNEAAPGEVNLTYGTAKVLPALDALADAGLDGAAGMADRAARWLAACAASGRRLERLRGADPPTATATRGPRSRRPRKRWRRSPRTPAAIAPRIWCPSVAAWPGCGPRRRRAATSPPRRSASTSPGSGTARRCIR